MQHGEIISQESYVILRWHNGQRFNTFLNISPIVDCTHEDRPQWHTRASQVTNV